MFQPCDIVLLRFPFSDLSGTKLRPVLVLTASNAQGDFLSVQITSQLHYALHVPLRDDDFAAGFLPKPSIVRPDKVLTLNQSLVVRRVGALTEDAGKRVKAAICRHFGCDGF